jgi:acetamidase/formamidase
VTEYAIDHRLTDDDANVHTDWDRDRDPVLGVDPGDVVRFDCRDATNGQLGPDATRTDVESMAFEGHPITGPVEVESADPGDALVVDVLAVDHGGIGWSYVYPGEEGWGLLPEEFPEAGVHVWELDGDVGHFSADVSIPLDPFPGVLGVVPDEPGPSTTVPPRRVGGNMDVKHLTAGSTLRLPVEVAGAKFSVGDGHAAQGDGEVCVTGIETATTVDLRFGVEDGAAPGYPTFETAGPFAPGGDGNSNGGGRARGFQGVATDLRTAAKEALRGCLDYLEAEHGMDRLAAYMLASACVDLKINELVDRPNWVVSAYLPGSVAD